MAIYDRPSDLESATGYRAAQNVDMREGQGPSPSLSEQTPGLDRTARARDLAMRPISWARERPAMLVSLVGGLMVIGIGTWLAVRSRRPSRLEMLRDRGVDLYDWLRSKM
jgi:hypothetical protein